MAITVLGLDINDYNTSAALVADGAVVAGAQEERFTRVKRTRAFPVNAMQWCLERGGLELKDVSAVAVSVNPAIYMEALNPAQSGQARWRGELLTAPLNWLLGLTPGADALATHVRVKDAALGELDVHYVTHHDAHAAGAFYLSPFDNAAALTIDAFGEKDTTVFYNASGTHIDRLRAIEFPHSIGSFYAAMTEYLGLTPYRHEWKLMAAAGHGDAAAFIRKMRTLIFPTEKGCFEVNLPYFNYHQFHRPGFFTDKLETLLGPRYAMDAEPDARYFDIAAATQKVTGEIVFHLLDYLNARTGAERLCLSGGVAMNCVLNARIPAETRFRDVFVPPMPDDSGTSIGAALHVAHTVFRAPRGPAMVHNYIGPEFSEEQIKTELERAKVKFERIDDVSAAAAKSIADGQLAAWFQCGMEFGDRALGARSILADPRDPGIPARISALVKDRRSYQPFAPSILAERAREWFVNAMPSPFMDRALLTFSDKKKLIPAVLNADGSARVQTVTQKQNPLFYHLISEFDKLTGVPLVLNTSFNQRGEPIVCTPRDALRTFFSSGLDVLFIGPYRVVK